MVIIRQNDSDCKDKIFVRYISEQGGGKCSGGDIGGL